MAELDYRVGSLDHLCKGSTDDYMGYVLMHGILYVDLFVIEYIWIKYFLVIAYWLFIEYMELWMIMDVAWKEKVQRPPE